MGISMKKTQTLFAILLSALFFTLMVVVHSSLSGRADIADNFLPVAEETEGREQAPDFAMLDMHGNEVRLSDFFGKPIVLNFWATWCPSCVTETPYFEQLYSEHGDEIHILKVNLLDGQRETRSRVDAFIEEGGYSFPIYFDIASEGPQAYGVRFIPSTFFIDADGYLSATVQGTLNEQAVQNFIQGG
jgi:thiol-disulfide isomerase/thioredoxin